jgi:hypothetical protein
MAAEFEKLAYEAALRGLDKQESLVEALRTRTGMVLAAATLGASLLGQQAFRGTSPNGLAIIGLVAFVASSAASVFVLLPNKNLVFSEAGPRLYESLFDLRYEVSEVYRRLTYELHRFWGENDASIQHLSDAFGIACGSLVIEIVLLALLWGGSLI